jgi:Secretion system C-terminal sorting domain
VSTQDLGTGWEGKIYPNPAQDQLSVTYTQREHPLRLVLYDVLGKAVLSETLAPNTTATTVLLEGLVSGLYTCKLYDGKALLYGTKIVVVR